MWEWCWDWYNDQVIWGAIGSRGFGWSPFLTTGGGASALVSDDKDDPKSPPPPTLAPPVRSDTPLTGFTTFGLVNAVTDGYLLTEGIQANSGIKLANYVMPVGAQSIGFRFQFTGAGDGDFLVASFGNNPPIGYGSDNGTSESEEVTVDMPAEHLAGKQGDLVIRLMSRGNPNAMVTVKGITLTSVDDADMDGLTNTQEVTFGTNPLLADSDGDGLDDTYESGLLTCACLARKLGSKLFI